MKKRFKFIILPALISVFVASCNDLDVPVTTQITPDVYPQDSTQFVASAGVVYAALRGNYSTDYFFMNTLTTDEGILPARGGNWYDNQGYMRMHYHTWTPDHGGTNVCWDWFSRIIGYDNQTMYILNNNMPEGSFKSRMISELRMVRALAYYWMMDMYGNVPIVTTYGDFEPKANSSRTEVFDFIVNEINECLPNLSTTVDQTTYGRPTKYMAYALLAKLYLNSEYYTGTARYNECIVACDNVINSSKYAIEPASTYLKMFYPNNGPAMKEFIFALPYDPSFASLGGTNGMMYHARYDVPRSLKTKFNIPFTPSSASGTLPEFYANFNDPNDVRNGQWLTGKQYLNDGVTPVMVTTTKKGYNQFYTGTDGSASYSYQVELAPNFVLRQDSILFDCGNDEIAWNMGYRNIKFFPDATSTTRNQNNDVPIFRYSDIILMKAEAILRGGTPTLGHSALSLVNQIRSNRTTSAAWSSVTLEDLYKERNREFAMECSHRNDMIRFGKYEGKWGFKVNADPTRRIFPIPTGARVKNPKLVQNPGY
ncbi:MAG TPA: RagB/SusD family nutrient uptake outer membrane protein [Paludibacter sp.]|nr:RagB/SusD family nutrient uptake outer membrane protein [Paludibacter sp.]